MKTVFLSGSRKMGRINDPIRERLSNMIAKQLRIVVGDASGADKAMQTYLSEQNYSFVTVYCSAGKCRNNVGNWSVHTVDVDPKLTGRAFYTVKDKAMAKAADYGFILWDGESKGSLANAETLLEAGKKVALYHRPSSQFLNLIEPMDLVPFTVPGLDSLQTSLPFDKAS